MMIKDTHDITTLADAENLATQLVVSLTSGSLPSCLLLSGDLGSGKTTFCQYIAKALGITETLTSPTFVILKSYSIPNSSHKLHHLDLYRIQASWELEELHIPKLLASADIILIEWPEKTPEVWRSIPHTTLTFDLTKDKKRYLTIH